MARELRTLSLAWDAMRFCSEDRYVRYCLVYALVGGLWVFVMVTTRHIPANWEFVVWFGAGIGPILAMLCDTLCSYWPTPLEHYVLPDQRQLRHIIRSIKTQIGPEGDMIYELKDGRPDHVAHSQIVYDADPKYTWCFRPKPLVIQWRAEIHWRRLNTGDHALVLGWRFQKNSGVRRWGVVAICEHNTYLKYRALQLPQIDETLFVMPVQTAWA